MRGLIFGIAIGIAVAGSGAVAPGADAQVAEPEVSITGFAYPFTGAQVCPDEPGYPAPSQMTPGSVTLTRTGSTADPLNVSYAVDGSAATPSGIATFAAGSATATFAVAPTVWNPKIFATIVDGDGYTLGSPSTQRVDVMMLPLYRCFGYAMQASPAAGDAGTEITVSGGDCKSWNPPNWVDVKLLQSGIEVVSVEVASVKVPADANGAWIGTLVVPNGLDPNAFYGVYASCESETGGVLDFASKSFDLTSPNDTTTTTSTTTTTITVPVSEESTSTSSTSATTSPTTVAPTVVGRNTTTPATVAVLTESDTLPRTGSNTSTLLAITAVLLVSGAALAGSRRRTSAQ